MEYKVSEGVRNRALFGPPYVNVYLTKSHLVIVPVGSKAWHVVSVIFVTLFAIVLLAFLTTGASKSLITLTVILLFSMSMEWWYKTRRIQRYQEATLDYLMQEPGWAAEYKDITFREGMFNGKVQVGTKLFAFRKKDTGQLRNAIKQMLR